MTATFEPAPAEQDAADTSAEDRTIRLLQQMVSARPGGEVRPQQELMARHVIRSLISGKTLIAQAGTGVGKSYGYMIPAIAAGKKVVISTATKQLSEQIATRDLPALQDSLAEPFTFALLKGRQNYLCHAKVSELHQLDAEDPEQGLFDAADVNARAVSSGDVERLNALLVWAQDTETGDRTEAPACSDRVWGQVSQSAVACPGASKCAFGEQCFAEAAKEQAKHAQLIVTNHAMVAVDLIAPAPMFADADAFVFDEAHDLEDYLSKAWGIEFQPAELRGKVAEARRALPRAEELDDIREHGAQLAERCEALGGRLDARDAEEWPTFPQDLREDFALLNSDLARFADQVRAVPTMRGIHVANAEGLRAHADELAAIAKSLIELRSDLVEQVRWLEPARGRQHAIVRTAPLEVGTQLQDALADSSKGRTPRTLIATSATLTVGGSFDQIAQVLGVAGDPDHTAIDVGTPFNYRTQVMLYVPGVDTFPQPVGRERAEHSEAVRQEAAKLIRAAGGRTLALFSTRKAAEDAAAFLRRTLRTPILCQGDAPPAQLIEQFAADEATSLCATLGFWHGVDVTGPSLSLVIMDKIPFGPMDDPLTKARMKAADDAGRSGFTDVYVAGATTKIAQGFGRLVRSGTDRGVVALLDPRMRTKGYGSTILRTLPAGVRTYSDSDVVQAALARLTGTAL